MYTAVAARHGDPVETA